MDESEAEEVAAGKTRELEPVDTFPSFLPASSDKPEEHVSVPARQRTPHSEKSTATPTKPMENTVNYQKTPVEKSERQLDDMMDRKTTPWKRAREETEAENKTPVESNTGEPPTKTAQVRRMLIASWSNELPLLWPAIYTQELSEAERKGLNPNAFQWRIQRAVHSAPARRGAKSEEN
ncbi:hypothetical protein HPB52_001643 [Rhipicephalus sanguineus]|uniref:Uncharacterized protein n=1 Tax=Rhipicephalus sanguineus TaxID=34632 RepID=A0A9D4Q496_RHISA|nr:hypothetical protein HPB52_001643 [Rhipicephalus sanguineus]